MSRSERLCGTLVGKRGAARLPETPRRAHQQKDAPSFGIRSDDHGPVNARRLADQPARSRMEKPAGTVCGVCRGRA